MNHFRIILEEVETFQELQREALYFEVSRDQFLLGSIKLERCQIVFDWFSDIYEEFLVLHGLLNQSEKVRMAQFHQILSFFL